MGMDPANPQLFSPLAYFLGRVAEDILDITADVRGSPMLVRCPGYVGQIVDKSPEFLLTPAQHLLGALPLADLILQSVHGARQRRRTIRHFLLKFPIELQGFLLGLFPQGNFDHQAPSDKSGDSCGQDDCQNAQQENKLPGCGICQLTCLGVPIHLLSLEAYEFTPGRVILEQERKRDPDHPLSCLLRLVLFEKHVDVLLVALDVRRPGAFNGVKEVLFFRGFNSRFELFYERGNLVAVLCPADEEGVDFLPIGQKENLHGDAVIEIGVAERLIDDLDLRPMVIEDLVHAVVHLAHPAEAEPSHGR